MTQNITRVPYEKLAFNWEEDIYLTMKTPWLDVTLEIDEKEKPWIQEATELAHINPAHPSVQKFFDALKEYPLFYTRPRTKDGFAQGQLETTQFPLDYIDFSSPKTCIATLKIPFAKILVDDLPDQWLFPAEDMLATANIPGTDLYDPVVLNTYLPLVRLEYAKRGWEGSGGIYDVLEKKLQEDEECFFQYMGWCARQSHYLTSNAERIIQNGINHFPVLRRDLQEYLADETGHHKFLAEVLGKLDYTVNDFELNNTTQFFVDAIHGMGERSALAFINLIDFSEAYAYEETDPLSELLKKSSKPSAGDGYQKHYQINFGHDHDMVGYTFCSKLAPQRKEDCLLALRIYELCSTLINRMESNVNHFALQKL